MRVLKLDESQSFYIVLRYYAENVEGDYTVHLFNKNTQEETQITLTGQTEVIISSQMNQLDVTIPDAHIEGSEYSFYVTGTNETKVLHRNKLFFTNQTTQDYNIDG